jgi:sugar porter (SP) family MFS transporter
MSYRSHLWIIAAIAGTGGVLFGYDMGVISGALLYIKEDFDLGTVGSAFVVSSVVAGAVVGALLTGWLASRMSRKGIIVLSAAVFVVGAGGAAAAGSVGLLVAARFVLGLGVGLSSTMIPLYVSEIAPARTRGSMVAVFQLAITAGILLAYLVNAILHSHTEWRTAFALGCLPAIVLGLGMLLQPHSPRWLVAQRRREEALAVLRSVRDPDDGDVEAEVEDIARAASRDERTSWADLRAPMMRSIVIFGVVAVVLSQITGINTVIYYAPTIFTEAGFGSQTAVFATAGIGALNFLATVIALGIVDRLRRRELLIGGMAGMTLSMLVLGISFAVAGGFGSGAPAFGEIGRWVAVGGVASFIAFFAMTWGVGLWVIQSEIYPLRIRGRAMSVSNTAEWFANLVIAFLFPVLLGAWGGAPVFWLLAGLGAFAVVFLFRRLPETKGKSLEEIERYWRERAGGAPTAPAPEAPRVAAP